ncbi:hypothetical protein EYF80_007159 [Liparis tanakae]|uniref:Uncharacterized protein n=1 Tax=Liparis tanakae TaxID=230148 RepID=A0A4Z2IY05_9TELE|nr:hypothetical protein EYF80_007159 [Liparis tanakae]
MKDRNPNPRRLVYVTGGSREGLDGVTSKAKPGCVIAIQKQDQYIPLKFIPIRQLAKNGPRDELRRDLETQSAAKT